MFPNPPGKKPLRCLRKNHLITFPREFAARLGVKRKQKNDVQKKDSQNILDLRIVSSFGRVNNHWQTSMNFGASVHWTARSVNEFGRLRRSRPQTTPKLLSHICRDSRWVGANCGVDVCISRQRNDFKHPTDFPVKRWVCVCRKRHVFELRLQKKIHKFFIGRVNRIAIPKLQITNFSIAARCWRNPEHTTSPNS